MFVHNFGVKARVMELNCVQKIGVFAHVLVTVSTIYGVRNPDPSHFAFIDPIQGAPSIPVDVVHRNLNFIPSVETKVEILTSKGL